MKKTDLNVSFDADKLNALRFYTTKKELNVEDELQAHLDRLYEKTVPVQVREYVESQSESEAPKQEIKSEDSAARQEQKKDDNDLKQDAKADDGKSSEKQPRQSKRQREKELAAVEQSEAQPEQIAEPEEVEEENQGMSMSM